MKCVFIILVDSTSSNDGAITYLKKKVKNLNGVALDGDMMQMRCRAQILNLVKNKGLKGYHNSIFAIGHVIKYVRSFPSTFTKFKKVIKVKNITCKSLVCLDVSTRWNLTCKMLEVIEKFQKVLEKWEVHDKDF